MPIIINSPFTRPPHWMALLGSSDREEGNATTTDSAGNIIFVALHYNGTDFDVVTAKYSGAGALLWQRILNGPSTQLPYSVTTDASDNIILSGPTLLAKYSSAGTLMWQRDLPEITAEKVLVMSNGEILVTGYTTSLGAGSNDLIMARLSSDGTTTVWSRTLGTGSAEIGYSAALDSSENIYVINSSGSGPCISKYNSSGTIQWQQRLSGVSNPSFFDLTITDGDDIYVAGSAGAPTYAGAMIVQYTTAGAVVFQKRYSTSSSTRFLAITHDSSGNIYTIGETAQTGKIFVGKYDSAGVVLWANSIGENNADDNNGNDIEIHPSGDVLVIGELDNLGAGGSSDIFHARLPADGSKLGTYLLGGVNIVYSSLSVTTATLPHVEAAAGMTDQAVVITNTADTLPEAAGTLVTDLVNM